MKKFSKKLLKDIKNMCGGLYSMNGDTSGYAFFVDEDEPNKIWSGEYLFPSDMRDQKYLFSEFTGYVDFSTGEVWNSETKKVYTTFKESINFKELMNDILVEKVKDVELPNSNLYLRGFGMDTNGNSVVKFSFADEKGMSIQINTPNFRNTKRLNTTKLKDLSDKDILSIEKELTSYIKEYGTARQKKGLKTFFKEDLNEGKEGADWNKLLQPMVDAVNKLKIVRFELSGNDYEKNHYGIEVFYEMEATEKYILNAKETKKISDIIRKHVGSTPRVGFSYDYPYFKGVIKIKGE